MGQRRWLGAIRGGRAWGGGTGVRAGAAVGGGGRGRSAGGAHAWAPLRARCVGGCAGGEEGEARPAVLARGR